MSKKIVICEKMKFIWTEEDLNRVRDLFYWYERNYGCFDKYDSVMIMTLAERGNIDLAEVMGSRR